MKTSVDCIPCFFRQLRTTVALIGLSKNDQRELCAAFARKALTFDYENPPIVFGRFIYRSIAAAKGEADTFRKEKLRIDRILLNAASLIEARIREASSPFHKAVHLSCAANTIDFGAGRVPDIKKLLKDMANIRLTVDHFNFFVQKLKCARCVLIIGDNCGEAFFDLMLLKQVAVSFPDVKLFYAVRSAPIINDVTIDDAKRIGLDAVTRVFSSGCDYPGLRLSKTSAYFKKIYRQADIVISKGQGNFESFCDKQKDIFYAFKIKCQPVSLEVGLSLGSLLFAHNKRLKNKT